MSSANINSNIQTFKHYNDLENNTKEWIKSFSDLKTYVSIKCVSKGLNNCFNEKTLSVDTKINRIYLSQLHHHNVGTKEKMAKMMVLGLRTSLPDLSESALQNVCNLISNSPSVKTYLNHCYNMMEENLKADEIYFVAQIYATAKGKKTMDKFESCMATLVPVMQKFLMSLTQDSDTQEAVEKIVLEDRASQAAAKNQEAQKQ